MVVVTDCMATMNKESGSDQKLQSQAIWLELRSPTTRLGSNQIDAVGENERNGSRFLPRPVLRPKKNSPDFVRRGASGRGPTRTGLAV